jgi:hypothetical protein
VTELLAVVFSLVMLYKLAWSAIQASHFLEVGSETHLMPSVIEQSELSLTAQYATTADLQP